MGFTDAGITEEQDYSPGADQPPIIISTPNVGFIEGTQSTKDFSVHVQDDGLSALAYSLTNPLPQGLSLVAETGVLTYDGVAGLSVSSHTLVVTDAVGSATSASFNINIIAAQSIGDYSDLPGNIENFGAVGDGVADDTVAIQAAMDSDLLIFFPPGDYKITASITITKPKIVRCGRSMRTGYKMDGNDLATPPTFGEQVRFIITDGTIDTFVCDTPFIDWVGGMFDGSQMEGTLSNNAFVINAQSAASGGTSGRIDLHMIGPSERGPSDPRTGVFASSTSGTVGVKFVFTGQPSDALVRDFFVEVGDLYGMHNGVNVDPLTGSQACYFNYWRIYTDDCHASIFDEGSEDSLAFSWIQGGVTMATQAESISIPSFVIRGARNQIIANRFFDYGKGKSGSWGNWKQDNMYCFDVNPVMLPDMFFDREYYKGSTIAPLTSDQIHIEPVSFPVNSSGFAPRSQTTTGGETTNADLANSNSNINQFAKRAGTICVTDDSDVLRVADGSTPTSKWLEASGTNPSKDITPS